MPQDHEPDAFLDTGEDGCGDLVLAIARRMRPLAVGQLLEIRAHDAGASEDIPAWCRMTGHELIVLPRGENNIGRFLIRKAPSAR